METIDHPYDLEICQREYFFAVKNAANGSGITPIPHSIHLDDLQRSSKVIGDDAFFSPDYIHMLFADMRLSTVNMIRDLYCDNIGRSPEMVLSIINKHQKKLRFSEFSFEPIWAFCSSMRWLRAKNLAVNTVQDASQWAILSFSLPNNCTEMGITFNPHIACVIDIHKNIVIAFYISHHDQNKNISENLAFYEAIASQRRPFFAGKDGLVWPLPKKVFGENKISKEILNFCQNYEIEIIHKTIETRLSSMLLSDWYRDIPKKVLPRNVIELIIDRYLHNEHKYSPKSDKDYYTAQFLKQVGYSQTPTLLFPELRNLLPAKICQVDSAGKIEMDGLHYMNPLLFDWQGDQVTLRFHREEEYLSWVFVDDEILCNAHAIELQRRDGSFRMNREVY